MKPIRFRTFTGFDLLFISVALLSIFGWIANLYKIFIFTGDMLTPVFILRGIGIFLAPVGAIMGYL